MTLIRTSLLNAIAVLIKMLTLLGINKVLAIYVGPNGYAALGQFQNAIQMITTFASGAINTGVTKYTAEYHQDELKQRRLWQAAGTLALVTSLVMAIAIIFFRDYLATWFLRDESYSSVFLWFAMTLVFFVFNALLLAILNGKKEISRYVVSSILGSVFSLIATAVMSMFYGLYGALVALAVYQSLSFFVTFFICFKAPWFKISYIFGRIDKEIALNLFKYALMSLTSAVCIPLSNIFIRDYLGQSFGWEFAGYWEAMWRLSTAYLMLITTTLGLYYLPRLSELDTVSEIKREVISGYKIILPVVACGGLLVYLLRDFIIGVLFTSDFTPMRELFAWQMVGDTLKVASWVLAYLMLGKAMVKLYIVTEIVFACGIVGLVHFFCGYLGFRGVAIAYAANYSIYLLFMLVVIPHRIKNNVTA